MSTRDNNDDGPMRFVRHWLTFNDARPARPRLLRNFVAVVVASFAVTALLAIVSVVIR